MEQVALLPPATKLRQGNDFTPVCDSDHRESLSDRVSVQGVSVQDQVNVVQGRLCLEGGLCPGGLYPGGLCPGVSVQEGVCLGVSVQGVFVQGGLCPGVCVQGIPVQGVLCPGGSLSRNLCPGSVCPGGSKSRVFLSKGSISKELSVTGDPPLHPYGYMWEVRILLECILVLKANTAFVSF